MRTLTIKEIDNGFIVENIQTGTVTFKQTYVDACLSAAKLLHPRFKLDHAAIHERLNELGGPLWIQEKDSNIEDEEVSNAVGTEGQDGLQLANGEVKGFVGDGGYR